MRHGSARKVLLFVALVALGTVIGIVLTRPASPHTVYLPVVDDDLDEGEYEFRNGCGAGRGTAAAGLLAAVPSPVSPVVGACVPT